MPRWQIRKFCNFLQNWLPWQRPSRYRKSPPNRSSTSKELSYGKKIAEIGSVDPERDMLIVLQAIIKKLEMHGKPSV